MCCCPPLVRKGLWLNAGNPPRGATLSELSDAPAYISRVRIVRERGPIRQAYLPAESQPITFGTHGPVREHYGTAPGQYPEHATTLDYVVAAAAG
jgi:hypothetical protein